MDNGWDLENREQVRDSVGLFVKVMNPNRLPTNKSYALLMVYL